MLGAAFQRSPFCRPAWLGGLVVLLLSTFALTGVAGAGTSRATDTGVPLPPIARLTGSAPSSLTFTWRLQGNITSVIGYALWLDGLYQGATAAQSATFDGLACQTTHSFEVQVMDGQHLLSARSTAVSGTTLRCGASPAPPPPANPPAQTPPPERPPTPQQPPASPPAQTPPPANPPTPTTTQPTPPPTQPKPPPAQSTPPTSGKSGEQHGGSTKPLPPPKPQPPVPPASPAPPGPPPSQSGASVLYVSPMGSDFGACGASAPCASLNRAYQLAGPGALVRVASGIYPTQTILRHAQPKGGPRVTFLCSSPRSCTLQ